jgi:hypothetical protein
MGTMHKKLKNATSTPRGKVIFFGLLIFILSALAGGFIYWNINKKQIIRNELENTIRKKTAGLYVLRYDSLKLDEVAGNLSLTGFKLEYDSLKYSSLVKTSNPPPILLKIEIPSLSITGVNTPRVLRNKEIVGKNIHISKPIIEIIYTNAGIDSSRNIPTDEVYKQLLGDLSMIKVDGLEISNARIITRSLKTGKEILQINNASIRLAEVAVDSAANKDSTRLLFAKQLLVSAEKIIWPSPDRLYLYRIDSISLNSSGNSAIIKKLSVDPQLNEDAFVKSLPAQADRFDFTLNNIHCHKIDMQKLLNETLLADSIFIRSSSFKIYRDLSIQRDNKNRVGSYPHQALAKISIPVHIKKLILVNCFVEYKEKNPRTNMAGKIRFHDMAAAITNISNMDEAVTQNNIMRVSVTARFLNTAPLKVKWSFYLQHPKGKFDVEGNLAAMRFKDANTVTQPLGPAKLEDGHLHNLQFKLAGNDYGINGKVKMVYENLKITVLEKEKGSRKLDKKELASLAANFMIKNSNPAGKKDEPRVVNVDMPRNTNRSIFYLAWKALFKGIKETAGIKK